MNVDCALDNGHPVVVLPRFPQDLGRLCSKGDEGENLEKERTFSPEDFCTLASNTFECFDQSPQLLPPPPGLEGYWFDVEKFDFERRMRYPWTGGRHPIFDVVIETRTHVIGVVFKGCRPFKGLKPCKFSERFKRHFRDFPMAPYIDLCTKLSSGDVRYKYLQAPRLTKFAFALSAESDRVGKSPILYYLFDEPCKVDGESDIAQAWCDHRLETFDFLDRVGNAQVEFWASEYLEWLSQWEERAEAVRSYAARVRLYLWHSMIRQARGIG